MVGSNLGLPVQSDAILERNVHGLGQPGGRAGRHPLLEFAEQRPRGSAPGVLERIDSGADHLGRRRPSDRLDQKQVTVIDEPDPVRRAALVSIGPSTRRTSISRISVVET